MNYEGKLYGRFKGQYFDTGNTSKDWDDMANKIKELEEKLERSVTWGLDCFESRAKELEEGKIIYNRDLFNKHLIIMVKNHDSCYGISWETIDFYLNEYCKTDFCKKFGHIWHQVTEEKALELWESKPIFAYDTSSDVEWQINIEGDKESLKDQLNNDCILVIEIEK